MIVTEEEAKTIRCQEGFTASAIAFVEANKMARAHVTPSEVAETMKKWMGAASTSLPHNCVGSACMAWRWQFNGGDRALGYCGKAGRP